MSSMHFNTHTILACRSHSFFHGVMWKVIFFVSDRTNTVVFVISLVQYLSSLCVSFISCSQSHEWCSSMSLGASAEGFTRWLSGAQSAVMSTCLIIHVQHSTCHTYSIYKLLHSFHSLSFIFNNEWCWSMEDSKSLCFFICLTFT